MKPNKAQETLGFIAQPNLHNLIIKRTALRVHQSPTVGNPPTALVHQVRQVR
ncbi:MAG: hypothetical protein RMZ43_016735 [Nostoc sp. CmiVER01]|uniref:hypothetical protein n=1 Tax=Nostoc sp. CmiVER01 TaxID=3075384 RepID=UPI002AD1FCD0|nr:hypothetical protein [Nostoc sp. CmiVER01]MDZ8121126.1 hypothetical protein [Nostoc sp. CmiVER01]